MMRFKFSSAGVEQFFCGFARKPVQRFLASDAFTVCRSAAPIASAGEQFPTVRCVAEVCFHNFNTSFSALGIVDGNEQLTSFVKVSGHPVG
jgi:hypothetical protein